MLVLKTGFSRGLYLSMCLLSALVFHESFLRVSVVKFVGNVRVSVRVCVEV